MIVTIAFLGLAFGLGAVPDQPSPDDPPQAKTSPDGDPLADARAATDRQDWDVAAQRFRSWAGSSVRSETCFRDRVIWHSAPWIPWPTTFPISTRIAASTCS